LYNDAPLNLLRTSCRKAQTLNVSLCDILLSLNLKFKEQERDASKCDTERDLPSPAGGRGN